MDLDLTNSDGSKGAHKASPACQVQPSRAMNRHIVTGLPPLGLPGCAENAKANPSLWFPNESRGGPHLACLWMTLPQLFTFSATCMAQATTLVAGAGTFRNSRCLISWAKGSHLRPGQDRTMSTGKETGVTPAENLACPCVCGLGVASQLVQVLPTRSPSEGRALIRNYGWRERGTLLPPAANPGSAPTGAIEKPARLLIFLFDKPSCAPDAPSFQIRAP